MYGGIIRSIHGASADQEYPDQNKMNRRVIVIVRVKVAERIPLSYYEKTDISSKNPAFSPARKIFIPSVLQSHHALLNGGQRNRNSPSKHRTRSQFRNYNE